MNYSMVLYILGNVLKFEGGFLLLPALVGFIYGESAGFIYLGCAVVTALVGVLMSIKKPKAMMLYTREGFVSVALSWIIMSIFGGIPMTLAGDIPFYVDSVFEIISGFTTTGASICPNVEVLTHATLMWRSFSHWVGGMGVFVFMMAILPMLGGSNMNLMKAESPGPSVSKLVPHIKDSAKILYGIYLGITVIEAIALIAAGMPVFDSITHTFGTVGTGGFGVKADSIASYTALQQNIITVFMILSGINYTAYYFLLCRKFKDLFGIEEVRWYLIVIFTAVAAIAVNVRGFYGSWEETIRHTAFQVASIITTTGYATVDFDLWPEMSKTILVVLMFIGACSGSTGGGMKVSRFVILFKTIRKELSIIVHPRLIKKIRMDGSAIPHEVIRATNVYLAIFFVVLFGSVLAISIDGFSFTTNFTAVAATLNNIGPGLDMVGPTQNFAGFSVFSKCVLMFDMLAGRLELFPVVVMFMPSVWVKK